MIVATKYIYNGESDEDLKWTSIAKLCNANKSGADTLKSKEAAQLKYMRLENDGDDVWRTWKDIKPDDEKVKKAKEGIKQKLWKNPPHVSDHYI